jgi:hypothetical protein
MGPGLGEYFLFYVFYKTSNPQAVGCRFRIVLFFLGIIKSKLKSRELDKFLSVRHKHGMYVN